MTYSDTVRVRVIASDGYDGVAEDETSTTFIIGIQSSSSSSESSESLTILAIVGIGSVLLVVIIIIKVKRR